MQDHLLVSTSYNQGISYIKQLTDNIDEANQWCKIAIVTMCHFTTNAKEIFTMRKNVLSSI
jgi:hypothetical protein